VILALFAASAAASHSTAFNKVEDVRVQPDDFPTQRLWAKERVVIELMSPGSAHKDEIADDQQDGANQRPQQKVPLNGPAAIIHSG
jgi:hypothetical protein